MKDLDPKKTYTTKILFDCLFDAKSSTGLRLFTCRRYLPKREKLPGSPYKKVIRNETNDWTWRFYTGALIAEIVSWEIDYAKAKLKKSRK